MHSRTFFSLSISHGTSLYTYFILFCMDLLSFGGSSSSPGRPVSSSADPGWGVHLRTRQPARSPLPTALRHAGRSLATRPQREPGRRNLSTCLINGDAETAVQTGPRQAHKEEARPAAPPSIDPRPLWRGPRRGRAGTWPLLTRGPRPARLRPPPVDSRPQGLRGDTVGSAQARAGWMEPATSTSHLHPAS